MTKENSTSEQNKSQSAPNKRRKSTLLLWIMLIAILLLFLLQWKLKKIKEDALRQQAEQDSLALIIHQADSMSRLQDSLKQEQNRLDSLALLDSLRQADSLNAYQDSLRMRQGQTQGQFQSMQDQMLQDSLRRLDSLRQADSLKAYQDSLLRAADQTPPSGQVSPPAGRYFEPIQIQLNCHEPRCISQYSLGDTAQRQNYQQPIPWNQSGSLFVRFEDSVGNLSSWKSFHYDIAKDNRCPPRSYPVPLKGKTVCVDIFEYPNQPDVLPKDMVSHDAAVQICQKEGKHLCSLDEWQAACKGKSSQHYPYGKSYDPTACATAQRKVSRSGRKENCRSWWGMQDMSGNLWEWTATPHSQRSSFFYVAGGSWDTQDNSSCEETKFSFYPQNQYPFVGFRCCKTLD